MSVIRHERTKYACRQCEQTAETSKVVTAPKPANMIPKSLGSAEAFAAVVTAKYVDALPLYRLVDILNRSCIDISRATLANWCVQLGSKVQVIIDAMKTQLLKEPLICADETTVQGRQTSAIQILYVGLSQRRVHPQSWGDYHGYLLSDGYSGYDTVDSVTQAAFMAHVRRKFTDAQKASPSKKAGKPEKALTYIAKLYGIEKRAKNLSPEARQQMRMQ